MQLIQDIELQKILFSRKIELYILRIDQIHPHISGNKWFKLKYNIRAAEKQGADTLLTFGGAYSNHIAAVAAVGQEKGFRTIGVIRGEENLPLNPTLQYAKEQGMVFRYMDRTSYRNKKSNKVIDKLKAQYGNFYLIPEGGTNDLAIKGAEEIVDLITTHFNYVCCSVGTGGTIAGIIKSCPNDKKVIGFPALKGDFMKDEIIKLGPSASDFKLMTDYHFGGYAKHDQELINFINRFKKEYDIPLDPIYTGKMMYGICDLIEKNYFEQGSSIVAIHTGGLQGITGFNERFGNILQ